MEFSLAFLTHWIPWNPLSLLAPYFVLFYVGQCHAEDQQNHTLIFYLPVNKYIFCNKILKYNIKRILVKRQAVHQLKYEKTEFTYFSTNFSTPIDFALYMQWLHVKKEQLRISVSNKHSHQANWCLVFDDTDHNNTWFEEMIKYLFLLVNCFYTEHNHLCTSTTLLTDHLGISLCPKPILCPWAAYWSKIMQEERKHGKRLDLMYHFINIAKSHYINQLLDNMFYSKEKKI